MPVFVQHNSVYMTLGGTADIREGIEEGDPVKIVMGTLQTASMFMMIGAAGSTLRAAGGKALGMVDDIAYKNLLTTAKTATTMGEAADGLSGGVQALQGVVTGNPVDVLAGVANIAMVDLPPGTTKKVIGELAEEGVEKITREAIEEVVGEGVEKAAREAVKEVTQEGVEKITREAVEEMTQEGVEMTAREAVEDVAEETGKAVSKQVDEVMEAVGPRQTSGSLESLNIKISESADVSTAELGSRLRSAKDTIESVCELDRLPNVDVEIKELPTREIDDVTLYTDGQYVRQAEPDALANVYIDPRGSAPEFALAHETGHHIDDQAFGAIDPETGNWLLGSSAYKKGLLQKDIQDAYEQLFTAIYDSQTYRYLEGSLDQAIDNEYNDIIKYTQYLLKDEELLARSYAQYVTIRSGNDILARQLEDALIPRYNVTKMWYAQDFDKIANAFDRLFRIAGMRQ